MSAVVVKEIARDTLEAATDSVSLTRTFRVRVDDSLDSAVTATTAFSIPPFGDPHPDFPGARLQSYSTQRLTESRIHFDVVCNYSTDAPEIDNPLNRPSEISFGFDKYQKATAKDINGDAITNSAYDFYDPPPEIDDSRPILTITKNIAVFDADTAIAYQDAVNSVPFVVVAPGFFLSAATGLAKIENISGRSQTERIGGASGSTIFYWSTTFDISFRREGWTLDLLDHGFNEWVDADGTGTGTAKARRQIYTDNGEPVSSPALLDGSGGKLDVSGSVTPIFNSFTVYKTLDFSLLGLP